MLQETFIAAFILFYFTRVDGFGKLLWSSYGIGQTIIFSSCGFFFFSSPNLSSWRLDVCHTSTHGVALV